jgi:hypothetical protein
MQMMLTISSSGPGVGLLFRLAVGGLAQLALLLVCMLIARIVARYGPLYLRQDECEG